MCPRERCRRVDGECDAEALYCGHLPQADLGPCDDGSGYGTGAEKHEKICSDGLSGGHPKVLQLGFDHLDLLETQRRPGFFAKSTGLKGSLKRPQGPNPAQ